MGLPAAAAAAPRCDSHGGGASPTMSRSRISAHWHGSVLFPSYNDFQPCAPHAVGELVCACCLAFHTADCVRVLQQELCVLDAFKKHVAPSLELLRCVSCRAVNFEFGITLC